MKKISLLGSTGSVGTQTLDIISRNPDKFQLTGIAGGYNISLLADQIRMFKPAKASAANKELAEQLKLQLGSDAADTKIVYGDEGLIEIAADTDADVVVTAIVGSQGLKPTLAAIEAGKQIGLANKETLVSAGHLVMELARKKNVAILPVDSEHSAIYQCLNGERCSAIHKLIITASGGSFRDRTRDQLEGVTVAEALQHPNWSMGAKITIDSATMVNKGLEVIEAHWLFQVDYDQIEVLVHPESIIHSMVEFTDYSVIAQLGNPDMRVPIQYALTYPERMPTPTNRLRLDEIGKLHFRPMDFERYPCMRMAYESGRIGGTMPTVFNAANEVAVARFLNGQLSFLDIERVIEKAIQSHAAVKSPTLGDILDADGWARRQAAMS